MKEVIEKLTHLVRSLKSNNGCKILPNGEIKSCVGTQMHIDDFFVVKSGLKVCDIEELESDCEFSLQEGTWYVVTVVNKDNKMYDEMIKWCWNIFPPQISCRDKNGNKLLIYYRDLNI